MRCKVVDLPGFRFHPTEEELVDFYLKNIIFGNKPISFGVIGMLNIYRHHPWELPGLASIMGEREWYFFVPRDHRRKQGGAGRPNRTTETGFWKATGSDRKVMKSSSDNNKQRLIGLRKTLVFYMGRAPRGTKTDWVMNEYRLPPHHHNHSPLPKEEVVVCKIYRKATSMKVLEQRAAAIDEEASNPLHQLSSSFSKTPLPVSPIDTDSLTIPIPTEEDITTKKKLAGEEESNPIFFNGSFDNPKTVTTTSLNLPLENEQQLPLLEFTSDWTQDSFWTQFNSPCLQTLIASPTLF